MTQLDLTPDELARLYAHLGDTADLATITRRVRRRMNSDSEAPGEAIAFLNLLLKIRQAAASLILVPKDEADGRRRTRSPRRPSEC